MLLYMGHANKHDVHLNNFKPALRVPTKKPSENRLNELMARRKIEI
jgi:hypothetical protein